MRRAISFLFALVLPGCAGDSEGDLAFTMVQTCLAFSEPAERVFRDAQEWQEAHRKNGQGEAPAIDFTRFQVAGRFDGGGSACTSFSVEGVSVEAGEVVVRATRHVSTQPCILILAHPQVLVTMPRREEPVRFVVTEVQGASSGPARACY